LSNVTDIFGLCGLCDIVQCVERSVVSRITFDDDFAIPQFRLSEHKHIINTGSGRMAEPYDSNELARPIYSIEATQTQDSAKQNEVMMVDVLAQTNHELGLALATGEIAYLVDVYLGAQATNAEIARNLTDAGLTIFGQANSGHCRYNICL
ncbi:phosphoribosylformylglycinamidine synthase, partial [Coemansia sp. RSA 2708]